MEPLLRDLGLCNVATPLGGGVREGEAFARMESEIRKLTDIHGDGAVDWLLVGSQGVLILREQGKDLAVGVWLAAAWFNTADLEGLAMGIHVLRDLIERHWETMSPPLARLRARRNLIEWLFDKLEQRATADALTAMTPLGSDAQAELVKDWNAIDTFWREQDSDAPAFFRLHHLLASLPVTEPLTAQPSVDEQAATQPGGAQPVAAQDPQPAAHRDEEPSAAPTQSTMAPATVVPSAGARIAMPAIVPTPVVVPPDGADPAQLESAVEQALRSLAPTLDVCLDAAPSQAYPYRISCSLAWALVEATPAAIDGVTRIPPPPQAERSVLEQLIKGTAPFAVARYAQSRLAAFPFWLDLCRHTYVALSSAGASSAAAAVATQARSFVERLPDIADLRFSDGMPFADDETRAWLGSIGPAARGNSGERAGDSLELAFVEARAQSANGRLYDALKALEREYADAGSARDGLRVRLTQCELVRDFGEASTLGPLVSPLLDQVEKYGLAQWEPKLARDVLKIAAAAGHGRDDHKQDRLLANLASLDFASAWQVQGSRNPQ